MKDFLSQLQNQIFILAIVQEIGWIVLTQLGTVSAMALVGGTGLGFSMLIYRLIIAGAMQLAAKTQPKVSET